jgi:hypothetical protein
MRSRGFSWIRVRSGVRAGIGLLSSLPLASCAAPLSQAECDKLLVHYVELLVRSDRPDVSGEELARMKREALKKGASDPQFRSCTSEVSRKQYECAIAAENADKLEQCML